MRPFRRVEPHGEPGHSNRDQQETLHSECNRVAVIAGEERCPKRQGRKWQHVEKVEPDQGAIGLSDERDEITMSHPRNCHDDEADNERDKRGSNLPTCVRERLAAGELGHMNLQDEQRNDDREHAVTEGENPPGVDRALGPLRAKSGNVCIAKVTGSRPTMALAGYGVVSSAMVRPLSGWTGRALAPTIFRNASICAVETSTGSVKSVQATPSVHGGVVSEPM